MATFFGAAGGSSAGFTGAAVHAGTSAATTAATAGFTGASIHAGTSATTAAQAGSLITAETAANIASGLSTLALIRQGQAAKVNSKVQARQVREKAQRDEVARRRRLIATLASQNATRAASGIASFEGSSKNIMIEDIRTGGASIRDASAGSAAAARSIESAGSYSRNSSFINAGATLLDQFDRTKQRG